MAYNEPNEWGEYFRSLENPPNKKRSRSRRRTKEIQVEDNPILKTERSSAKKKVAPTKTKKQKKKDKRAASTTPVVSPPPPPTRHHTTSSGGSSEPIKPGLLILLMMAIPAIAIPLFFNRPINYIIAGVELVMLIAVAMYFLGRARSVKLRPFYTRRELSMFGQRTINNRPAMVALIVAVLASGLVLLPEDLGTVATEVPDAPPPKNITNEIETVNLYIGYSQKWRESVYMALHNTSKVSMRNLINHQPPPENFHWVLYYMNVAVTDVADEFYTSNMTIRMIDNYNQIYLPDYGAGAINAPRGYARKDTIPYWTPAFLVADTEPGQPKRVPIRYEVVPYQGADHFFVWHYPTKFEKVYLNEKVACEKEAEQRAASARKQKDADQDAIKKQLSADYDTCYEEAMEKIKELPMEKRALVLPGEEDDQLVTYGKDEEAESTEDDNAESTNEETAEVVEDSN